MMTLKDINPNEESHAGPKQIHILLPNHTQSSSKICDSKTH